MSFISDKNCKYQEKEYKENIGVQERIKYA